MENLDKQSLLSDEIKEKTDEDFSEETNDSELDEHEHVDPVETKANLKKPSVIIRCEICSTKFINANMPEKHLDGYDLLYCCKTCGANIKLTLDFIDYLWEHSTDKLYKCPLCNLKIKERTAMTVHLQTIHGQFKKYVCKICKIGIKTYTQYLNHKSFHTKDKPFKCNQCGSSFNRNNYLRRHTVTMHTVNPMPCEVCPKICRNKRQFQIHKSWHDRKPAKCEECEKTFTDKWQLRTHERIHTGEKPYSCRFCSKSFTAGNIRSEHEKIHSGYKPYICSICKKGFVQQAPLKRHEATHRLDKPAIQCKICTNQFQSKKGYNVHLEICKENRPTPRQRRS